MNTALGLLKNWETYGILLLVFGFFPGLVLRQVVRFYPKGHPRRRELMAELYARDYGKRLLFVCECMELGLSEGVPARWRSRPHHQTTEQTSGVSTIRVMESGYSGPQVCAVLGITV